MKMGWSSVVVFVPTVLVVLNFLVVRLSVRSNDEFWLNVGNQLEAAAPSFIYDCFKAGRQAHMAAWFDKESKTGTVYMHEASGWKYLTEKQYSNMVKHVLHWLPIKSGHRIFELGCGVGAALNVTMETYGPNLILGGSDISADFIKKCQKYFPKFADNFYHLSMTSANEKVPDSSQDHVLSFGALGMYLYREEMTAAVAEAVRILKPGGGMCLTHFIEPNGRNPGSILQPVEKSHWEKVRDKHGLERMRLVTLLNQGNFGDRYAVCFTKKRLLLVQR
jgi:ubiquinone/menaquinone biosynthesis C-methylase UbiE